MVDEPEFERWRTEAGRALESARLQVDAGLHNWACFLAEQAAQLAVKAFLHGVGQAPWGHDLVVLGRAFALVMAEGWPPDSDQPLARLSRHYIPARYPDAHPSGPAGDHYRREDADEAIVDASRIIDLVDRSWHDVCREARG
ncbi:MAG: HEPN domain-containing protein [Actinomycetota bacterium]